MNKIKVLGLVLVGLLCWPADAQIIMIPGGSSAVCGDGKITTGETCDDNNTTALDGCSSLCLVETGAICSNGSPSVCNARQFSLNPARDGNGTKRWDVDADGDGVNDGVPVFGATAMTAVFICNNSTDTGTSFPCTVGGTFTETGNVTTGYGAPFTQDGDAVGTTLGVMRSSDYNGGVSHQAPSTTLGDITTQDYVIQTTAYLTDLAATQYVVSKYDSVGSLGPALRVTSGGILQGVANATTYGSYTIDNIGGQGQWVDVILMCDSGATNGARMYIEGYLAGSAGNCPSASQTTAALKWTFGANPSTGSANPIDGKIATTRLYTCTGCMTTTADMDAEALRLNSLLTGVRLVSGLVKDPLADDIRTTPGTLEIYRDSDARVRRFRVAAKRHRISRICRGWDSLSGDPTRGECSPINVLFGEPAETNLLQRSNAFDNATWTKTNTNVLAAAYTGPDEIDFLGDRWRSSGAAGVEQVIGQTSPTLSAGQIYTISFTVGYDLNNGSKPYLVIRDGAVANSATWFGLNECNTGIIGTGLHSYASPPQYATNRTKSSALARPLGGAVGSNTACEISIDIDGTAATHQIELLAADTDGVLTSTSANNDVLAELFDAQMSNMSNSSMTGHVAGSRIPTAGATATRTADGLRYSILNWPRNGTVWWGVVNRDHHLGDDSNVNHSSFVVEAYKDANNFINIKPNGNRSGNGLRGTAQVASTGGGMSPFAEVVSGGVGLITCCSNSPVGQWYTPRTHLTFDGKLHYARGVYLDNDFRVYADGDPVSGITATGFGSIPDLGTASTTAIDVGYNRVNGLAQPDGVAWVEFFTGEANPSLPTIQ